MKNAKNLGAIAFLIVLIGWGIMDSNGEQVNQESAIDGVEVGLKEGYLAPDFQLETLEGQLLQLSDFRGDYVILNLWATWCPPCRAEMPHMQDFYDDYKDKGVTILAVNLTTQERNRNAVEPFVKEEFQLTFPVVLDVDGQVRSMYQAYSIPTTYFIDPQGKIQTKVIGPLSYERMKGIVGDY